MARKQCTTFKYNPDRMRALREAHGLTPTEFARRIGAQKQQIDQWEKDNVAPRVETLARIVSEFNVKQGPNYFFICE